MIRTTGLGLSHGEPALTYEANAATFEEIRCENLAQIELAEESEPDADERDRSHPAARTKTLAAGLIPKGSGQGNLVFIPKTIHTAIATSETWGQFFTAMPLDDLDYVVEFLIDCDDCLPTHSEKFDPDMPPSFTDGDWPEQKMLGWLPPEICQRYGKVESWF